MGGFNPRPPLVEARIRELEKLAKSYKKDQVEIEKTIKLFKALLKGIKKTPI